MPKTPSIRNFRQREYFLDSAIAVGAYHQHIARHIRWALFQSKNDIVMKLTLAPLIDVLPSERTNSVEHPLQGQRVGESFEHEGDQIRFGWGFKWINGSYAMLRPWPDDDLSVTNPSENCSNLH